MSRTIRHFSLHRIGTTELRIVADFEDRNVLPIIEAEEKVIREYINRVDFPHQWVMLYILEDFQPLIRQLQSGVSPELLEPKGYKLTKDSIATLSTRPVVNLFDLSNLSGCNVFINHNAMLKAGYWNDHRAIEALLAHEHAHPLAENKTTEASRGLIIDYEINQIQPANLIPILKGLAENLCILAPREIFTNQYAIENGFSEELFYLDMLNFENAVKGVSSRDTFLQKIHQEIRSGKFSRKEADLLILGGDLSAHLPLAMEIAPFYRSEFTSQAQILEQILTKRVFPKLDPIALPIFKSLQDEYFSLQENPQNLIAWAKRILSPLVKGFMEKGLTLNYRIQMVTNQETKSIKTERRFDHA
jgi:hypothetical protein